MNSVGEMLTAEMVTLVVPVFFTLTVIAPLVVPDTWLGKLNDVGETVSDCADATVVVTIKINPSARPTETLRQLSVKALETTPT
jgi:hypothetical protein